MIGLAGESHLSHYEHENRLGPHIMIRRSSDDAGMLLSDPITSNHSLATLGSNSAMSLSPESSVHESLSSGSRTLFLGGAKSISCELGKRNWNRLAAARIRRVFVLVRHCVRFVKILARPLATMMERGWDYHDAFSEDPERLDSKPSASVGASPSLAALVEAAASMSPANAGNPPYQQYSGMIPDSIRDILNQTAGNRTAEDVERLQRFFAGLRAFSKWPVEGQKHFLKEGHYKKWGANRMIVRQNHPVGNMFIIISGQVNVLQNQNIRTADHMAVRPSTPWAMTRKMKSDRPPMVIMAELTTGACIGELAFVSNIPTRSATIITKTPCEFISVDPDAVEVVLAMSRAQSNTRNLKLLSRFPILKTMSADPATLMRYCTFKKYMSESVIFAEGNPDSNSAVFFLLSGSCQIVKILPFLQHKSHKGNVILKAAPPGVDIKSETFKASLPTHISVVHRPVVIKQINVGEMFGEGHVPGLVLTRPHNNATTTFMMNATATSTLPSGGLGTQRVPWEDVSVVTTSCAELLHMLTVDFRMFATDSTKTKIMDMDASAPSLSLDDVAASFADQRKWFSHKRHVLMDVVKTSERLQRLMKRLKEEEKSTLHQR
ncbi:hypothetical protein SeMB42_g03976 [Synchytrium endobioticum]|uniref:Cyclic nucleotide-binding domain-containing protein n=1 Tax=Synchytrium endobioticum TaxID=286115 RepID=A0A507CNN8_9FUNG|nr:hypothetical protein SeLEV6574_g06431 [Synchytrium endobioticum]TPX45492.1 hypothetical protein SeMB42_g03976 [Synchytrium endobioticum]